MIFRFNFPDLSYGATVGYKCKTFYFVKTRLLIIFISVILFLPHVFYIKIYDIRICLVCICYQLKYLFVDVHLSRQHYKACVRKNSGKAYICYHPCTVIVGKSTGTIVGSPVIIQVMNSAYHEINNILYLKYIYLNN